MSYSLLDYGAMLTDSPRRRAYVGAMRALIKPGSLVVDVGAGPGFFAVLAAKLGAEHVFAIDLQEQIHIGKNLARDNGVADRITWVQGRVEDLALPRAADLIISDLRGVLPFYTGHFGAIAACRTLLAPTGVLLPARDTLFVALTDDEKLTERWHDPWALQPEGVDLSAARSFAINEWGSGTVAPSALLGPAAAWGVIDYATATDERRMGTVSLPVTRAGTLRALQVWFDAVVWGDHSFSNAPGEPPLVYGAALFPVERVLPLEPGARVDVTLTATPAKRGCDFSWHVRALSPSGALLLEERHHSMLSRPLPAIVKAL